MLKIEEVTNICPILLNGWMWVLVVVLKEDGIISKDTCATVLKTTFDPGSPYAEPLEMEQMMEVVAMMEIICKAEVVPPPGIVHGYLAWEIISGLLPDLSVVEERKQAYLDNAKRLGYGDVTIMKERLLLEAV